MSPKYLIIVVLYNTKIRESQTIIGLKSGLSNLLNSLIVIWDNSPEIDNDYKNLDPIQYKYINSPENLSLSKIYNKCLELYSLQFEYFWVFDDDSEVTTSMILQFKSAIIENREISLFLPKVKYNNQLVSPGKFKFIKASYFKEDISGSMNSKGIIAIMSGTCIAMNFFLKYDYKFDEDLAIYGIDTKFYLDYCKFEDKLYVVDYFMNHDLSFFSETKLEIIINKFKAHKNSLRKVVGAKSLFHRIALNLYLFYLSLKNAFRYKTIKFL